MKGILTVMLTLLSRIFIKNNHDTSDPAVRQAYGVLCSALGIFLNILLFAGKIIAGVLSGSIAITADAFNNLSDMGSCCITLTGFKMAGQQPDKEHPFGHGRLEYISGLVVSILILFVGFELFRSSLSRIFQPTGLELSPAVIGIMSASMLVKAYMGYFNRRIGQKIDSATMRAAAADSTNDVLSTGVVLLCALISHFTHIDIDGYCGIIVSLLIFWTGIKAAIDTISPLLGQAPDPAFVQKITDIVLSYQGIIGLHDLIVHNYGPGRVLISLHAEVPADSDILVMHDRIDLIEKQLRDTLHCSAVIHMDPICMNDAETNALKEEVNAHLAEISPQLTLHDFRIVKGPTHTNVIFDVVTPYRFYMTDSQLIAAITDRIQKNHPDHFVVIEVDKEMV